MDNESYQKKIVELNYGEKYQGDVVSHTIIKLVMKYVESPILDIGAGSGALINELNSKNHECMGIDLIPMGKNIKKGSITNLEFKDNEFNTIFCTEVIEHLTDEQINIGLNEVKRVLKKDGHFVMTVPYNENVEANTFTCPTCGDKFHSVGHLQSFDEKRITKKLAENGFKIELINVYPLLVMSKLPAVNLYWRLIMYFDNRFEFNKTLLIVAKSGN